MFIYLCPLFFLVSFVFSVETTFWEKEEANPMSFEEMGELQKFLSLSIKEEEKRLLYELVADLAHKTVFELIADRENLLQIKELLKAIHPFRLLACILEESTLHELVKKIESNEVKWIFLSSGLERSMKRNAEAGLLTPYILGFSEFLNVDMRLIEAYIDQKKYGALLRYLVQF